MKVLGPSEEQFQENEQKELINKIKKFILQDPAVPFMSCICKTTCGMASTK
jgi:hypothetical protein